MAPPFPSDADCVAQINSQLERLMKIEAGPPLSRSVKWLGQDGLDLVEAAVWAEVGTDRAGALADRLDLQSID